MVVIPLEWSSNPVAEGDSRTDRYPRLTVGSRASNPFATIQPWKLIPGGIASLDIRVSLMDQRTQIQRESLVSGRPDIAAATVEGLELWLSASYDNAVYLAYEGPSLLSFV
jgi:hypothetical protein